MHYQRISFGVFLLGLLLIAGPAATQPDQIVREVKLLPWVTTPSKGSLAAVAQFTPGGEFQFLDTVATSRFLELNQNPPRSNQYTIAPKTLQWFAILSFDRSGYIRDDERLNPDEMLAVLKAQNVKGAEERRRLGLPVLHLDGWAVTPHYDVETRRLEWGTRLTADDGSVTVNYLVRILGRSGVMSAVLVTDRDSLEADRRQFNTALGNLIFVDGERYAEFRQGDRMAEYGLAALVIGGAAAAAASSGLLKGFGKLIAVGALGAIAAVVTLFKGIFRKKETKI